MKKVYKYLIIICIIVVSIPIIFFFIKYLNNMQKIKNYEKQIVNFYNSGSSEGISQTSIESYNVNLLSEKVEYYDISPLIKNYIDQVEGRFEDLYFSASDENKIFFMKAENYNQTLVHLTEKGNVKVLDKYFGLNRIATISELEKIIEHIGNDKYSGWRLHKDSEEIIKLPYGFYLKYRKCTSKRLNKVKKVLSCRFINRNINYKVGKDNRIELVYLNTLGQEEKVITIVQFNKDLKLYINLDNLYWENSGDGASLRLCNTLYEQEDEEISQELNYFSPSPK